MLNYNRHYVLISLMFCMGMLFTISALGREYSTETTESSVSKSAPRKSKTSLGRSTKASSQAERSATTYSTEDIIERPSVTDPQATTNSTRAPHKAYRTRTVPGEPPAPKTPETPRSADIDTGYSPVGGELHFRPGPYLAGRRWCSDGDWGRFWPALLDIDVSYSWSGNSGRGEFAYWPYGYHYSWGNNDTFDEDQARMSTESDPNAIYGRYTTYSTEDIRPLNDRSHQPSDPNVPIQQSPAESFIDQASKSE